MEAVNQLQLGGPTIYRQVAPSLLVAVPYLPLAFAAGASIIYYSLTWGRASEGAEEHLLDAFIQEADILAGLDLEDGENELTPAHLEALLPDPPLLLLAVPLVEAMVWTGVAAERLARLGFKLDQRLGAELALAFVWVSRCDSLCKAATDSRGVLDIRFCRRDRNSEPSATLPAPRGLSPPSHQLPGHLLRCPPRVHPRRYRDTRPRQLDTGRPRLRRPGALDHPNAPTRTTRLGPTRLFEDGQDPRRSRSTAVSRGRQHAARLSYLLVDEPNYVAGSAKAPQASGRLVAQSQ